MNKTISLKDRADFYNKAFPKFSKYGPLFCTNRIFGVWIMGNDYRSRTGYYGSYPPNYLKRVMSMFPDCTKILHLFSGSLSNGVVGIRFDINEEVEPDIKGNAECLSAHFDRDYFDLILADPPYSSEDAMHYGTPLVSRNKVLKECITVSMPEGFIGWLDQVKPMYRKDEVDLAGVICIDRSTNHRVRALYLFQKKEINKNAITNKVCESDKSPKKRLRGHQLSLFKH